MVPRARLEIRPFESPDLGLVRTWLEAEGLGIPAGASHQRWGERLRSDPRIVYRVGEVDGEPIGFFRLDIGPDRCAEVTILVVAPARRRGFGGLLLGRAIDEARERQLGRLIAEVRHDNDTALAFFEDAGFEPNGRQNGPYLQLVRVIHRVAGQRPLRISP